MSCCFEFFLTQSS